MAGLPPQGEPFDGHVPQSALATLGERPLSFYVHVPFCATRCGYCDFNTYTAEELGEGVSRASWRETAIAEVRLAAARLGDSRPNISTIFVGGGTPTLLPAADLNAVVDEIRVQFGLSAGCEITTEANPDSVTAEQLEELRAGGFNRISFGMQSAVPHVLAVLERTHRTENVSAAVTMARQAGFEHINLDVIYGTPGESTDDLLKTLDSVDFSLIDHVSAYALIIEEGTRLAKKVERGEVPMPDDDDLADKYEVIDQYLEERGLIWYEVSNWAKPHGECQHNIHYWLSNNWWGVGPGAHSHVGGVRWWNHKHPASWTKALAAGESPALAHEVLSLEQQQDEVVLLQLRLARGLGLPKIPNHDALAQCVADELVAINNGRAVLTPRGRLLADAVVRDLLS